jgi:Zn-finger in ubiquitin-hydrolases and other protein
VAGCSHLDQVLVERPASVPGCEDCLKTGDRWVHLRVCRTCGHVGCCDSSPNRHATKHHGESGHPIISSMEPGEDWSYCYEDDLAFVLQPGGPPEGTPPAAV